MGSSRSKPVRFHATPEVIEKAQKNRDARELAEEMAQVLEEEKPSAIQIAKDVKDMFYNKSFYSDIIETINHGKFEVEFKSLQPHTYGKALDNFKLELISLEESHGKPVVYIKKNDKSLLYIVLNNLIAVRNGTKNLDEMLPFVTFMWPPVFEKVYTGDYKSPTLYIDGPEFKKQLESEKFMNFISPLDGGARRKRSKRSKRTRKHKKQTRRR